MSEIHLEETDPTLSWKKLSQKTVYKGYRNVIRKTFEFPNQKTDDFDIIQGHSFVTVVPFTPDNELILVKQYRPGPEHLQYSFPSGYIDPGESREAAAHRELLEETGFQTQEMVFLKEIPDAYTEWIKRCFVATNCVEVNVQALDENEFIAVERMPLVEFREFLKSVESKNFGAVDAAYLALDYLGLL